MAQRAAIVTGASSGIGLAIARRARRGGLRADRRRAAPGEARGGRRGAARRRATRSRPSPATSATRRSSRRSSPPTASASGASTCSSTTRASASARRSPSSTTKKLDLQLDVNLRSIDPLLPRVRRPAAGGRRRAPQRARRQHVVDLGQARPGLAVGLRGDEGRRSSASPQAMHKELARRGHQVDRAVPGLRRHADDRLRQGAGPGGGHDPRPRTSPRRCALLLKLSPGCIVPEIQFIRPGRRAASRRAASPLARRARARPSPRAARPSQPRPAARLARPAVAGDAPGARRSRRRGRRRRARRGSTPRGGLRGRAARARWRAARALGAGEAVPRAREGDEARAPAVAVGGEHRADAAGAVGVGADDDLVARGCPSSIASRVRSGRQSMARRRSSIG